MLGYDYEIIYKKGKDNFKTNDLSVQFKEDGSLLALSLPSLGWLKEARKEWLENSVIRQLIQWL
jgi:hypothetical protein